MRTRISFTQADEMLLARDEVLASGCSERELRDHVSTERLIRVHRGQYVDGEAWRKLWPEGRHLLRVLAVRRASPGAGPVFTHLSAAALWGLPLYRVADVLVHVLIDGARHSRVAAGVARHEAQIVDEELAERHGILCTSLTRTVADLARTTHLEAAVSAADAALRSVAVTGQDYDEDAALTWRETLGAHARPGRRGVRQARWVTDFVDGRAQLPGESVSRLQLFRLGFSAPELQVPVTGSEGDRYFLDFGFRGSRAFGEFDGEGKYLEPGLRRSDTPLDAVLAEKRREDDVRGVTGWSIVRWGHAHITSPDALGRRLAAFGVFPPG